MKRVLAAGLLLLLAAPSPADELEDLVKKFESERSKPYNERYQTVNLFSGFRTDERARTVLLRLYRVEKERNIQSQLLRQIAYHDHPEARAALIEALGSSDTSLQYAAAQGLKGKLDLGATRKVVEMLATPNLNPNLQRYLREALQSLTDADAIQWLAGPGLAVGDKATLLIVLEAIERLGPVEALDGLARLSTSRDREIRQKALEALGAIDDPKARDVLEKGMNNRDPEIAGAAMRGLARYAAEDEAVAQKLLRLLKGSNLDRKLAAADALGLGGVTSAADELIAMLDDRRWQVRAAAILNLRRLRVKAAIGPLIARIGEEEGRLQGDVVDALEDLTGKGFGDSPANWQSWWAVNGESFVVPPKKDPTQPVADEDDGGGTVAGGYYGIRVLSKRVLFVIDHSGSMSAQAQVQGQTTGGAGAAGKNRLEVAKDQLIAVLAGFDRRVLFNVIFFDHGHQVWQGGLTPATDGNKNKAADWIQDIQPSGGTNIFDPMEVALQMEGVDTIFLLTDGDSGSGKYVAADDIAREIEKLNLRRRIKINTIALGGHRALLQRLAEESGGRYVQP